jgi:AcrR family transcriptional regulator
MFHTAAMGTSSTEASAGRGRRSYDSTRRQAMAEETRLSVIAAATRLFAERGWSGTGMRDIAKAAGVSVETVYGTAGSKAQLLMRALDVGIVGDDEPIPLAERPEFRALGTGDRSSRLRAVAGLVGRLNARVALLHRALGAGASGDASLAAMEHELYQRQLTSFGDGLELVLDRRPPAALVEALQAIGSPEAYLLLVRSAGWSQQRYQEWLADTFGRLLDIPEEKA